MFREFYVPDVEHRVFLVLAPIERAFALRSCIASCYQSIAASFEW